jgi:hypothetical protein
MTCGGEERNYGDAVSKVKQANSLWLAIANSADQKPQEQKAAEERPRTPRVKSLSVL